MKISSILVLTLSAGTLVAQERGIELDSRVQLFGEMSRPVAITVVNSPAQIQDEPLRQTGLGIRFMGELASFPHFYYELGGKTASSSNFTLNGPIGAGNSLNLTGVKVTESYWSLGTAYLMHPVPALSLGAHLEARGEALCAQGNVVQTLGSAPPASLGQLYASTTYLRAWLRLSADLTIPMGKYRPYIGVDVSGAISRTSQTEFVSMDLMDNRTLRSLAPNYAAAFYLGARF